MNLGILFSFIFCRTAIFDFFFIEAHCPLVFGFLLVISIRAPIRFNFVTAVILPDSSQQT